MKQCTKDLLIAAALGCFTLSLAIGAVVGVVLLALRVYGKL